jgi:multidrug efflux pump subunit AcrB
LAVQTPEHEVNSLNDIKNTPVTTSNSPNGDPVPGLLSNIATVSREATQTNANQANIQPVYEVYANADGRDLGSIAGDISKIVADEQKQLSPGNRIEVVGQIDSMNAAFRDLAIGILFAAVFVYLLMVVNYQTWGDPLVVILALPATFCGIITMLYLTGTTLSVPSLMGAIMAVGVASANSILLVTFAREQQLAGMSAFEAAIAAGADDRGGDDRRHDPDGDRRRRRRAERGARTRRYWRAPVCNSDHPAGRAVSVRPAAQGQ